MRYACDNCDREVGRENLIVKKVSYHEMGKRGRMIKQRTTGWLCRDACIPAEEAWRLKPMMVQTTKQVSEDAES